MLVLFANIVSCFAGGINAGNDVQQVQTAGAGKGMSMRVLWRVSSYHITEDAKWGEAEAKPLLSKPLDITPSSITFDGQTCDGITFKEDTKSTDEYFAAHFHVVPEEIGVLDKSLRVVKSNCSIPGFSEFVRLNDRRLIVRINGVLFVFKANVNL